MVSLHISHNYHSDSSCNRNWNNPINRVGHQSISKILKEIKQKHRPAKAGVLFWVGGRIRTTASLYPFDQNGVCYHLQHPNKGGSFRTLTELIRTIKESLRQRPSLFATVIQDLFIDPDLATVFILNTVKVLPELLKPHFKFVKLPPESYDLIGGSDDHMKP